MSAALLFVVQPMFTKMVLPRLGGAPSVWSVAIVFFQAALLAGYAYAHLLTRFAPGRTSVIIHLVVMAAACLALPLSIAAGWGTPPALGEAVWLIGLFVASIGLPFFALSANGPLLQAWFARTDHPAAKRPVLPLCREQYRQLPRAAVLSAGGRAAGAAQRPGEALVAGLLRADRTDRRLRRAAVALRRPAAERGDCGRWRCLAADLARCRDLGRVAAVPSGLLVAVTAHISTDVAAVPLLWVLPLALYLLTFIIVFQRRPIIPHWLVVEVQPIFILALASRSCSARSR